jgi:hypothetical protein
MFRGRISGFGMRVITKFKQNARHSARKSLFLVKRLTHFPTGSLRSSYRETIKHRGQIIHKLVKPSFLLGLYRSLLISFLYACTDRRVDMHLVWHWRTEYWRVKVCWKTEELDALLCLCKLTVVYFMSVVCGRKSFVTEQYSHWPSVHWWEL